MKSSDKKKMINVNYLKFCVQYCLVIATSVALTAFSQAQIPSRPDRGVMPNGSYSISDIENISLENGNVNHSIPLASLPPLPGSKLSWTIRAIFNSKLWNVTRTESTDGGIPPENWVVDNLQVGSGWQIGGLYLIDFRPAEADFDYLIPGTNDPDYNFLLNTWTKAVLFTPDGAEHELRPIDKTPFPGARDHLRGYYKDTPYTTGSAVRYYSFDGSYIFATIDPVGGNWTVYLPDGTRVQNLNGVQRIIDTNGNAIKIFTTDDGFGNQTTHYQDERSLTPGPVREITYTRGPAGNFVKYQTVGGNWMTITLNFGSTVVQGKTYPVEDKCSMIGVGTRITRIPSTTLTVLRSIVLPQTQPGQPGRQFSFSYNSDTTDNVNLTWKPACNAPNQTITVASHGMGGLSQVVTPSGATVNYSYSVDGGHALFSATNVTDETITSKVVNHDGVNDTWTYDFGIDSGSVTGPDGSSTTETFYSHEPGHPSWAAGFDGKGGLVYRTNRSNKVLVERHWTTLVFTGASQDSPGGLVNFNSVVDAEYTTLLESGLPVKMSAKTFQYDYNGNLLQATDYDWFNPAGVSRDAQGVPTGVPVGATVLRTTTSSYYNSATSSGSGNVYAKRSVASPTPLILNAPQQTTTGPSQMQFSYDNQVYGTAPSIGNLTKVSAWDDQASAWRNTTYGYDSYGNPTTITDPNNNVTTVVYDSATHAQPTQVTVNPLNGTGTQTTTTAYDSSTGLVTSVTDPNNQTTTTSYINQLLGTVDPFGRPGIVTGPQVNSVVGGVTYANQQRKVKTTYYDDARQMAIESDLNQTGDYKLKSRISADQLGRVIATEGNEDGTANYTISAQTVYIQMGLITLTSNPKRNSAASTDGWMRTTRDTIGRVTEVATFLGATQPPNSGTNSNWTGSVMTSYNSNQTTVTDQAGKMRRSETDALGRLIKVTEDPNNLNYQTNYFYDSLGNLRKVEQGAQTRWFAYDSLSRLIYAMNPEQTANPAFVFTDNTVSPGNNQWSMKYTYQANGNLATRVDARNITTAYGYDGLNRNTTVDYSDSTPDVTRTYDTATLGKGRLYKTENTNGTRVTINSYDTMGRPLSQSQQFYYSGAWGSSYTTQQAYNLAGGVTSQTYPSNHTTTTNYDSVGRFNTFSGNLGAGGAATNYVTGTTVYTATGQVTQERFGTTANLYHRRHFNSRGQMYDVRLGTGAADDFSNSTWNRGALRTYYSSNLVEYNSPPTGQQNNNGNVYRQDHFVPLNDSVTDWVMSVDNYGSSNYDALNRLTGASENAQSYIGGVFQETSAYLQSFGYDRYGNRQVTSATGSGLSNYNPTYNTATNRINGLGYDATGNITSDALTGGTMTYDAENRMLTATSGGGGSYVYDGDGRRVRRITAGGQEWWYVYGLGGELIAEYSANAAPTVVKKEYGYRGGQLLVTADSGSTANLALGKTATQSSTDFGGLASRAVDGNTSGNWADNSVSHTTYESQPWWQVDLGSVQQIGVVKLWNRTDCCSVRLKNFYVLVSDAPFISTNLATAMSQAGVSSYYVAGPVAAGTEVGVDRSGRYVRVQLVGTDYLHMAEVEVRGGTGIQWLLADQLGSTRMVIDQTGSLSGIKRRDYAPFGEELTVGIRNAGAYGYVGSNVRQKFGSKERDNETGLDYFLARYFSSVQGRFMNPDEFKSGPRELWVLGSGDPEKQALVYADITNPQSLNKYQYCFNNPLRYVDPDGQNPQDGGAGSAEDRDIRDYLAGRITKEELQRRQTARAVGALAGVAVIAGPEAVSALMLWAARNPQAAQQITQEVVQTSTGNPAPATLGTPLTSAFNVSRETLLSGRFLIGSVGKAEVAAQFSKAGDTLIAGIGVVWNKEGAGAVGGATLKALLNSIKDLARQEGLKKIELQAIAVVNKDLEKRLIADGWKLTKVKVLDQEVDAYVKTIELR